MQRPAMILTSAVLSAAIAVPAFADVDIASLTCGEFVAMSSGDRLNASQNFILWINDSANAEVAGGLAAAYGSRDYREIDKAIDGKCQGAAADANIIMTFKGGN